MNRFVLAFLAALAAAPVLAQEEESPEWVDAIDGEGRFSFVHPEGWAAEPWEKGGRRGLKVRPPQGDPFQGGLFGVEYYADPAICRELTVEKLAKIFHDYYVGQKAVLAKGPLEVELDGAAGLEQRFVVEVVRQHEGKDVEFDLEYRVICVKRGEVAYVVNLGAESRILEKNAETCERLLAGVRLTP